MNIDNELNCVDLIKAVIKIHELCSNRDCKNCIFFENHNYLGCQMDYPIHWKINSLKKLLKEHESEETK